MWMPPRTSPAGPWPTTRGGAAQPVLPWAGAGGLAIPGAGLSGPADDGLTVTPPRVLGRVREAGNRWARVPGPTDAPRFAAIWPRVSASRCDLPNLYRRYLQAVPSQFVPGGQWWPLPSA